MFSGLILDDALFGAVLAGPGEFVVLLQGACMCYTEVRYFSGWISEVCLVQILLCLVEVQSDFI